eukprot:607888-Hanusia_phi.AAC.1
MLSQSADKGWSEQAVPTVDAFDAGGARRDSASGSRGRGQEMAEGKRPAGTTGESAMWQALLTLGSSKPCQAR